MYFAAYYDQSNDYLLIKSTSLEIVNKIEKKLDIIILKDQDNNIIGFNIKNISKIINNLKPGLNILTDEEIKKIKKIINNENFNEWKYLKQPFIVGQIIQLEKVVNSNKLNFCQVDVGTDKILNIICGAKNVKLKQLVVVAQNGAFLPNGQAIVTGKVRDIISEAMICSERELGLEPTNDGILVLNQNQFRVGMGFDLRRVKDERTI